jgi:hypothetical protein
MTPHAALLPEALSEYGVRDPIELVAGSLNPSTRPGCPWLSG